MTSFRTGGLTKDFGVVDGIRLNVDQDTCGSVHVLQGRGMDLLARCQLCVESSSS